MDKFAYVDILLVCPCVEGYFVGLPVYLFKCLLGLSRFVLAIFYQGGRCSSQMIFCYNCIVVGNAIRFGIYLYRVWHYWELYWSLGFCWVGIDFVRLFFAVDVK